MHQQAGENHLSQQPIPETELALWNGPLRGFLFGLAPGGVFRAPVISHRAVVSYTTFSPLPIIADRRYILCGTFRQRALKRAPHIYSRLPRLRGAVSYGVRTFLFEFPQSDPPSL